MLNREKMINAQSERVEWIEAIRAFAMLMVVVPHFIASFCPEVFSVWQSYSLLLKGISGKHGVAIFCVLLGYFSSKRSSKNFPTYIAQRYFQFAVNIGVVLVAFVMVKSFLMKMSFVGFVKNTIFAGFEAVVFGSSLNPTLWCVRDMFFGSLFCFVLGNYCKRKNKWMELFFIIVLSVFLYFIDVWIAICVFGAGLRVALEIEYTKKLKLLLCVIFVVVIPFLYRHPESQLTYAMQGISCCLFMYICMCIQSEFVKKRLRFCWISFIGNISFYMFLWHTPINIVLKMLDLDFNMWVLFAISFTGSIVLSVVQNYLNIKWIIPNYKKIQINTV